MSATISDGFITRCKEFFPSFIHIDLQLRRTVGYEICGHDIKPVDLSSIQPEWHDVDLKELQKQTVQVIQNYLNYSATDNFLAFLPTLEMINSVKNDLLDDLMRNHIDAVILHSAFTIPTVSRAPRLMVIFLEVYYLYIYIY